MLPTRLRRETFVDPSEPPLLNFSARIGRRVLGYRVHSAKLFPKHSAPSSCFHGTRRLEPDRFPRFIHQPSELHRLDEPISRFRRGGGGKLFFSDEPLNHPFAFLHQAQLSRFPNKLRRFFLLALCCEYCSRR
jgi:hypothetical protein